MFSLLNRQSLLTTTRAIALSRNAGPRAATAARLPLLTQQQRAFLIPTAVRYAANPQSGKPASDNWSHTAKNVKEEIGQVAHSVGKSISGIEGGLSKGDGETAQTNEILEDAVSLFVGL
jgi:hypothetical protein